jgi:hypothetical protein
MESETNSGLLGKSNALTERDFEHELFKSLSENERRVLQILRQYPQVRHNPHLTIQGAVAEDVLAKLPGKTLDEVVGHINVLAKRQFVDMLKGQSSKVTFVAKDPEEITQYVLEFGLTFCKYGVHGR